jgi:hypothetical protein
MNKTEESLEANYGRGAVGAGRRERPPPPPGGLE